MGACGSKEDVVSKKGGKKGKKGGKKGDKGKKTGKKGKKQEEEEGSDDDEDFAPISLVSHDIKPGMIQKDINKVFKTITEKREKLKTQLRPFLAERRGILAMLDEEKERLMSLLDEKSRLETEKVELLNELYIKDADEVFRCYETKDKPGLVSVLGNRTRNQLEKICAAYEAKYNEALHVRLASEGQKLLGKLFTGALTNFSKLLLYRVMPQDERDAGFLKEFTTKGMSIQDENILEVVLTRTNRQLSAALNYHADDTGKSLRDVLSSHSYKNYRDFMTKVLECNRDERNEPFDEGTALKLATELYEAGAGKTLGLNAEPFIRILAVASKAQIDSINEKYKGQQLMKDIDSKLGGDFAMAVKIRCTDKYVYLAQRLALALNAFSKDKDLLCRVLGSLSRPECVKVKEAYDKAETGRSLEAALKSACSGEPNFLKAALALISGDMSQCPLGSDKEPEEDEMEISAAGVRARTAFESQYNRQAVFDRGEQMRKDAKAADDDDIPSFDYEKSKSNDVAELSAALKECESVRDQLDSFKESIKDEIVATKETYFAIHSHCYETETWIGTLRSHVSNLRLFDTRRDSNNSGKKK